MVDIRKIKPKKKVIKPKSKVKVEVIKKKPIDWEDICGTVLDFIHPRDEEYLMIALSDEYMMIGKRVKITEIINNDNNIFQPKESSETKYHYKYFHFYNSNIKTREPKFGSPKFYPSCPDMAVHYLANFR